MPKAVQTHSVGHPYRAPKCSACDGWGRVPQIQRRIGARRERRRCLPRGCWGRARLARGCWGRRRGGRCGAGAARDGGDGERRGDAGGGGGAAGWGNAVDAAVAVGLALAVTYPTAGEPRRRRVHARADGGRAERGARLPRGGAPRRAPRPLPGQGGQPAPERVDGGQPGRGRAGNGGARPGTEQDGQSAGGNGRAARRLAADGFPATFGLARSLRGARGLLERFAESRRVFLNDGRLYAEGRLSGSRTWRPRCSGSRIRGRASSTRGGPPD